MKKVILFAAALIILTSFASAKLEGDCYITNSTCGAGEDLVENLYFSYNTNAHVCYDESTECYGYKLCCPGSGMYFMEWIMGKTIAISDLNNAHVQNISIGSYPYKLDIIGASSNLCSLRDNSCYNNEYCLFSISSPDNAHVGQCNDYGVKFCCPSDVNLFLNVTSLSSSSCGSSVNKGDVLDVDIGVDEVNVSNGAGIPSENASVLLKSVESGDIGWNTTDSNGNAHFTFSFDSEGNYTVYAVALKGGYGADQDYSPNCTIEVNGNNTPGPGDGGPGDIPGTYLIYGDCYCPSGSCSDGIGKMDVSVYNLSTHQLVEYRPESLECFLTKDEEVPFFGFISFIVFLIIIGNFYNNEIFKKKNISNKSKEVK
jgi:hypothetical protein